ncbi:hypothetical protein ABT040_29920 [Streptomyces sp. NPDC002688]|uniref:hypothetical protein n=1 Tax=Streptomyces sp. NPDC002688 TaxID=3154423 RepID=UPI00332AB97B
MHSKGGEFVPAGVRPCTLYGAGHGATTGAGAAHPAAPSGAVKKPGSAPKTPASKPKAPTAPKTLPNPLKVSLVKQ